MILINLLPPELRRRQGGVSPLFASLVGGGALCLLLLLLFAWIQLVRIPAARALRESREEELRVKTAQAEEVRKLEQQIAEFTQRRNKIVGLLAHKVYWARTIDEFVGLLNGPWVNSNGGFEVRCQDLTIVEASGDRGRGDSDNTVNFAVNWHYKLIGKERPLAGDYINSFFSTIKASKFWSEQGFTGKPEDTYRGDVPRMNTQIQRVVIEGNLEWQRVKTIKDKNLAGR